MSKPKRPQLPADDDAVRGEDIDREEDLVDEDGPGDAPPGEGLQREELFLDDTGEGEELLQRPTGDPGLDDESAWPDDPALHRLPVMPWDDVDEDDLDAGAADGDAPARAGGLDRLVDEGRAADTWLDEDGLVADDEDDLDAPRMAVPDVEGWRGGRILAGHEEVAVLVELGGVRLPAVLATGMAESALSIPLRRIDDRKVEIELGGRTLQLDDRGLHTRIRLGPCRFRVRLRLVEGVVARLVLGRQALAGRLVVDPAARGLLGEDEEGGT